MSGLPPLQCYDQVDSASQAYAAKVQATQPTHKAVIQSVKDTVAKKMDLSQEQKDAVKHVFLAQIGDLADYDAAKDKGPARWEAISLARQKILLEFEKLQKELGDQLDFTWDQLLAGLKGIRSASLAGSSSVTAGTTGTGSDVQLQLQLPDSFFSTRS